MRLMADTTQADERQAKRSEKQAAKLAREMQAFAKSHGGSAEGQLAHIGRGRIRVALVGANGEWGNLVARTHEAAEKAAEKAGITLHDDFDGDLAAKVRTGRYEWSRMAGIQVGGPSND
ncbi:hypothetical protein [Streptomyces niger]|uniref:hypothetical protein n=1 Tax=Streptomyces niger TaxID=66373 RepID=UPI000DA61C04|nr:hypothetical protein [Streptomyces niger]